MQKSAKARLQIRNLETVISPPLNKTTTITAKLPITARITTNHTEILR